MSFLHACKTFYFAGDWVWDLRRFWKDSEKHFRNKHKSFVKLSQKLWFIFHQRLQIILILILFQPCQFMLTLARKMCIQLVFCSKKFDLFASSIEPSLIINKHNFSKKKQQREKQEKNKNTRRSICSVTNLSAYEGKTCRFAI